jgi:hypothetical protein
MNLIRPWLYIGKYADTVNHALLASRGIGAMLQLAEHARHPQIPSLYLPVQDGLSLPPELLRRGVTFVRDAYQRDRTILIACGAGISRSATFCTAGLKEIEQIGLLEAFTAVKDHHPDAMPAPALWSSLCAYYHEPVPYEVVLELDDLD